MRNTGKALIAGVLVVELAFGAYLLSRKGDRTVESSTPTSSPGVLAATSPTLGDSHVTAGSVVGAAQEPRPEPEPQPAAPPAAQAHQPIAHTPAPAENPGSVSSKTAAVPRVGRGRDSLRHRGSYPVSSSVTDQLVKESSKLDPSLPPPTPPVRDAQSHRGSNPVAAAMTEQLVRESAKLDPALPPPNPSNAK